MPIEVEVNTHEVHGFIATFDDYDGAEDAGEAGVYGTGQTEEEAVRELFDLIEDEEREAACEQWLQSQEPFQDVDEMVECPACNSEQAWEEALLGGLGHLVHFRCQCCGAQWHR